MLSKQKTIACLFFLTIAVAVAAPVGFLSAADVVDFATPDPPGYVQLAPLPSPPASIVTQTGLAGYLQTLFWLAIVLAGVLAVLMITKGGILYMTSEAFNTKAAAKNQITMAIVGFLLAISSVLILTTINPDLLKFNLLVRKLEFKVPENLLSGASEGCTTLVALPVTGCTWFDVTVTNPTNASARCEEAIDTTNNWISGLDSYCANKKPADRTTGGNYNKCCLYIPPKNGCSGRGIKEGYTQCRWSTEATINPLGGTDCTGVLTDVGMTSKYVCEGTDTRTGADCCAKK